MVDVSFEDSCDRKADISVSLIGLPRNRQFSIKIYLLNVFFKTKVKGVLKLSLSKGQLEKYYNPNRDLSKYMYFTFHCCSSKLDHYLFPKKIDSHFTKLFFFIFEEEIEEESDSKSRFSK